MAGKAKLSIGPGINRRKAFSDVIVTVKLKSLRQSRHLLKITDPWEADISGVIQWGYLVLCYLGHGSPTPRAAAHYRAVSLLKPGCGSSRQFSVSGVLVWLPLMQVELLAHLPSIRTEPFPFPFPLPPFPPFRSAKLEKLGNSDLGLSH